MELGRGGLAPAPSPCAECPGRLSWSNKGIFGADCPAKSATRNTLRLRWGCRASIERRRPSTPGRMQLPLVISSRLPAPGVRSSERYGIVCNSGDLFQDEPEVLPFREAAAEHAGDILPAEPSGANRACLSALVVYPHPASPLSPGSAPGTARTVRQPVRRGYRMPRISPDRVSRRR